jgi:bifunctional DNA-binding transcriptional regulator/antitoxin component of YhaV-PrlF toxin-antitoxin module
MEDGKMIDISKIYRDKDGAGRLYIPKKVLESLGWKDKQQIMIRTDESKMTGEPAEEGVA